MTTNVCVSLWEPGLDSFHLTPCVWNSLWIHTVIVITTGFFCFAVLCVFTVILCNRCFVLCGRCMHRQSDGSMSGSLNFILFPPIVPSSQQINLSAAQRRHRLANILLSGFHRRQPGLGRSQWRSLIAFDKLLWKSCFFSFSPGAFREVCWWEG